HNSVRGPGVPGRVWARPYWWAPPPPHTPSFPDREQNEAWPQNRPERTPNNARRMTPGGFQAYEHQWATVAAFKMATAMGRARVAGRVAELNGRIKDGLAAMKGVTLHTPRDPALSAGICCFEVAGKKPGDVVKALLSKQVIG